ncbi:MAG: outer membrane protein assembly factor BamA [Pseudomonadota bacterium]
MTRNRPFWPRLVLLPLALAVASTSAYADTFVVKDIRLEGLGRLSASSVYALLPFAAGETISDERSADLVRALFASGQFEDVQALREGDALVVRVVERPSISTIELSGNQSINKEDLLKGLKTIGLSEGEVFKRAALDQVRLELQRQYAAQGRYGAVVTATAKPLPRNRVGLSITIKEGDTARIKRISINGNNVFKDPILLKQLQLQSKNLLSFIYGDDKYSREKLTADIEILRSYYLDRGYLRFSVDSTQVSLSPNKDQVYIDINVTEGEPFKVGEVRLAGELPLPESDLKGLLLAQPGQVYSQKVVTLTNEIITRRLGREGYLLADVQGVPELDDTTHTAKIVFYVNPNRVMSVRRINFTGNLKTDDSVLRREMRQFEGAQASVEKIDLSKVRLQRLGFFSDVKIDNARVPGTTDQVDLNVAVTEQASGSISASLGYSQNAGLVFGANVSQTNFLGTGNRVSIGLNRSDVRDSYNVSFLDPYFTPEGISRGYNFYLRQTKLDNLNISNYSTDSLGANISFSYPIDETETISFSAGIDKTDISLGVNPSEAVFKFTQAEGNSLMTYTGTASWGRNTLNRGTFPTAGASQSVAMEVGLPGSDVSFYKLTYNAQRYFPVRSDWVGRGYARLGYGDAISGDGLPFYRNFFGGGFGSVRGYRDNSMGPRSQRLDVSTMPPVLLTQTESIGGNVQIEGGVELIFPVPFIEDKSKFRTLAFFDVGNIFDTSISGSGGENFKPSLGNLRYSVGIGASWITPIGPLTFAIAKPLNSKEGDDTQAFQFSLGQGF